MSEVTATANEMKQIFEEDAWYGPGMRAILQGITAEQAAARPIAGGHSIWELVLHVTAWENVFRRRTQGESVNEPEAGDFPPVRQTDSKSWEEAVSSLFAEHGKFIEAVSALSDSALENKVPGKDWTTGFLVRGAMRHAVYHSGQISLLKKSGM